MQSLPQVQRLSRLTLLRDIVQAPTCFCNILLQHTQPPHCRAKREEATGSSAVPDAFQPRGNIHKSTHSIFQNYPRDLTLQKKKKNWEIWGARVFSGNSKYLCQMTFQGQYIPALARNEDGFSFPLHLHPLHPLPFSTPPCALEG